VTGGSESLARGVAERLSEDYEITVFTTCARDYITWRNELPQGKETLGGVSILRFEVEEERDLEAFNAFAEPLYSKTPTEEEQASFLRKQGPYVPRLVEALETAKDTFAAVLFFTYLYYPTCEGLLRAGERSILVPTAHDEPPLRFPFFERLFGASRAFAFCSAPEEALVRERFSPAVPTRVAGIGVEVPLSPDVPALKKRHSLTRPFFLYAGRIDAGKGCQEMVEFYRAHRAKRPEAPDLVLIGKLAMALPEGPGVRYLGFLSDEEKSAAMAGAELLLCPSPYESLSIVLLEAFAAGTPALVTERSAVLKDHCVRSNGGLFYQSAAEFSAALDVLERPSLRRALGENGKTYVATNYTWGAVLSRYRELIEAVSGSPSADPGGTPSPRVP
jgi:glycosyltransferase involved in cell wall biosynthesis